MYPVAFTVDMAMGQDTDLMRRCEVFACASEVVYDESR